MQRSEAKLACSLFLLVFLTELPVTAQIINPVGINTPARADVEFNQGWLVKDVVGLANKHKVKVSQLESSYVVGSTAIQDGYVNPENETTANLEADYTKKRLDYFADIVALESRMANYERIELQPRLNAMKAILNKQQAIAPLRISKATFYGEISNLTEIARSNIPAKVNVVDQQTIQKLIRDKIQRETIPRKFGPEYYPNQANENSNFQYLFAALNPSQLFTKGFKNSKLIAQISSGGRAPDFGASFVYPSANGGRYTRQTMRWGQYPGFRYEETYEHDFFLYNYDRATYLDPRNVGYPNCLPAATYWSTTWPALSRPYLDTRFGQNGQCEVDELAYTIGVAFANQLFNGTTYETYIRTANGNASSDRFRLSGQIGYRSPLTNCPRDWTWCSFGKSSVVLVPAWSVNVPNTRSWVR